MSGTLFPDPDMYDSWQEWARAILAILEEGGYLRDLIREVHEENP